MSQVTLEVPDETMLALRVPQERAGEELQLAAAMKLFEMGRLSAGGAAALAGLPKPAFLSRLEEYGIVSFDLSKEELLSERPLA
jgi:predicted HTH domain antitoxin